jgi:hypothetical protein
LENPVPHDAPAPKPPTPLIPLLSGDNDDSSAPESPRAETSPLLKPLWPVNMGTEWKGMWQ